MDKIIGFALTTASTAADLLPEWVRTYDHLKTSVIHIGDLGGKTPDWYLLVWGHGDFSKFAHKPNPASLQMVVGYDEVDLATLEIDPLQNRGLVLEFTSRGVTIRNDALGMMPVVYGRKNGIPYVSTAEEAVVKGIGPVTLGPGLLVSYLLYQSAIGRRTLWKEIRKQYANTTLTVKSDGTFSEQLQPPLEIPTLSIPDPIHYMWSVSERTIREYTDPRDKVILPLSSGHDSRLILLAMTRPERIIARSYPSSWPAMESWETMIPKASAAIYGVEDWGLIDFKRDYSQWTEAAIRHYGTLISGVQVYLFGASQLMGEEHVHLPVLSGVIGDVVAGIGIGHIEWNKGKGDDYYHFKLGCHCHAKEWSVPLLDSVLTFDWRSALETVKADGRRIWRETEGHDDVVRATLIRLRNRCSQYITYPWAATDIWNSLVPIYCDRYYVQSMLGTPRNVLRGRVGQKQMLATYYPRVWPHAGLDPSSWREDNTMNLEAIKHGQLRSVWPLLTTGLRPASPFFRPGAISSIIGQALKQDEQLWFRLNSLQSLAWAIGEGWVRNA